MQQDNTNIPDIRIIKGDDGNDRHLLDSADKIIHWINKKFEDQANTNAENPERERPLFIDLSNCIICTVVHDNNPSMTNICELAGKIDCIVNTTGRYYDEKSKFHTEVLEEIRCFNSIIYAPFFHNTKFHKAIRIEYTQFIGDCHLGGSYFEENVFIQHCKMKSLLCDNALFNNELYLWDIDFDAFQISLRQCEFNKEVQIGKIRFDESRYGESIKNGRAWMSFYGSNFNSDTALSESHFKRILDFSHCKFNGEVKFNSVTSDFIINFSASKFNNQLLLSSNSMDHMIDIHELYLNNTISSGRVDIESCAINSIEARFLQVDTKGIFRICNCKISRLDLDSFCNNGYVFFDNNVKGIVEISLNSAINNGIIELENTEIRNLSSRKTARLLKDSAYKSNNSIDALYYKSEEHQLYKKELENLSKQYVNRLVNHYSLNTLKIIVSLVIIAPTILISFCIGMYIYVLLASLFALLFIWTPLANGSRNRLNI